jgi:hypothetical protein
MKKTVAILGLTGLIALNGLLGSEANAAENASLKDAYKTYNTVLTETGGEAFNLVDINKDGIPELIVDSLQVYTYTNNGVELMFDSMVVCTFYYSEQSKYLLYYDDWKENSNWLIYEIDSSKLSQDYNSLHFVESFNRDGTKYGYQADGKDAQDITLKELNSKLNAKLPNKKEIKMIYSNTEANRSKYLSPQSVQTKIIAKPSASKVWVDSKVVNFQAYTIEENNYFKLRDIAAVLNNSAKQFEVGYDAKLQSIQLTTDKAYTSTGTELATATDLVKQEAQPTASTIYLNDKEIKLVAYNIGGSNYFKLRDLGKAINFGVTWDGANNAIKILTSEGYQNE